jgi:TonB family protein
MIVEFGRSCGSIATEEEMSRPGVARPRLTPEHPIRTLKYPDEIGRKGEGRQMEMLLLVNEDGYVTQAKVFKSSGSTAFDRTTLEWTRDWRLAPGRINGEARCMWFTFFASSRFLKTSLCL